MGSMHVGWEQFYVYVVKAPKEKALSEHVHDLDCPQPTDPQELHTSERAVDTSSTVSNQSSVDVCSCCLQYLYTSNRGNV